MDKNENLHQNESQTCEMNEDTLGKVDGGNTIAPTENVRWIRCPACGKNTFIHFMSGDFYGRTHCTNCGYKEI